MAAFGFMVKECFSRVKCLSRALMAAISSTFSILSFYGAQYWFPPVLKDTVEDMDISVFVLVPFLSF